ncbi:MFS transporter [Sporolactobacillus pectinivorans]|uniref:MFS transporter n=1 Tax=Sporolactobacillus pectinivorans TaxID=1591408 RepID=UPI000C2615CF|nr:MFS transporter [Sporolactobacillus pectinivorans]
MNKNYRLQILFYFISSICIGMSIYENIPLYSSLMRILHVSQSQSVSIGSIFSLGHAIGFIILGWLMSKIHHKKLLLTAFILLILDTFLIGILHTFPAIMAARFFQGLFSSAFVPIIFSVILRYFPGKMIPLANSAVTSGFVAASVIGQLFASSLFQSGGWFLIYTVQAVIYAAIFPFLLKLIPASAPHTSSNASFAHALVQLVRDYRLWLCYVVTFTLLFAFVSMYTMVGTYYAGTSGNFLLVFRSFGLIGIVCAIYISSRTKKWTLNQLLSLGLLSSSVGIILMAFVHTSILLILFSILFAFGITLTLPMVVSVIGRFAGKEASSAIILYTFILFVGATAGPIVLSPMFAVTDLIAAPFFCLGVSCLLVFCAPYSSQREKWNKMKQNKPVIRAFHAF